MKSTVERWLLSSEGFNNHIFLHFTENISKVTKSTIELRLLSSEGINNYKLLHFLLLTATFHLHSYIITFSRLKRIFLQKQGSTYTVWGRWEEADSTTDLDIPPSQSIRMPCSNHTESAVLLMLTFYP
jgi:hypothetical protein